jgi:hypothetical protein
MDATTTAAIISVSGALMLSAIATWRSHGIEQTKRQAQANQDAMAERRFSMEFWERRAALAEQDAERTRGERDEARKDRDELRQWVLRVLREHPELGDINHYEREPEDLDGQDDLHHQPGADPPGSGTGGAPLE